MKKIVSIAVSALLLVSSIAAFSGCGKKSITVAVPNDTTNEARALLLLEQEGII